MPAPSSPCIGVFDSGIGGLSVARALRQHLPGATLSYLADGRYTPWGDRPAAWVTSRCLQLARWLIDDGAQLVVLACNTGTTQAIAALRARWPDTPFVGVEPGIKPAVAASHSQRVAVMATTGTLRSARLQHLVATHAVGATVLPLPCPGLAEAIEVAGAQPAALAVLLDQAAEALRALQVDTVVLGCTHYPLVAQALQQRLGPGVALIDTADAVARRAVSLLGASGCTSQPGGALRLASTGDTGALQQAARRWLQADASVLALTLPEVT